MHHPSTNYILPTHLNSHSPTSAQSFLPEIFHLHCPVLNPPLRELFPPCLSFSSQEPTPPWPPLYLFASTPSFSPSSRRQFAWSAHPCLFIAVGCCLSPASAPTTCQGPPVTGPVSDIRVWCPTRLNSTGHRFQVPMIPGHTS